VISEVLAVVGSGHRVTEPGAAKPAGATTGDEHGAKTAPSGDDGVKPEVAPAPPPPKAGNGAMNAVPGMPPVADSGTPVIAVPERHAAPVSSEAPVAPARKPAETARPGNPTEVPN
jgi:hypothetical protein